MNDSSSDLFHFGCLLDGKGGLAPFDVSSPPEEGRTLWLHLNMENPAARDWLKSQDYLNPVAVEALLTIESRPRLTRLGNSALLAFRGVNLNDGAQPDDMIGIRLWVDETRVISTFRRNLKSVDSIEEDLRSGEGPRNSGEFIAELASQLVTRMSDLVDNLEETIADLEAQVLDSATRETRFGLSELRRQIIALRRYLGPQREALASLISSKLSWLCEDRRISLRETSDQLIRHLEDLDAVRERAAVTQEELQSRFAEQQNVRMYVLSIVSAIFLPLGFLTGLLGINVGGIPGADHPWSFAIFLAFLILLVGGLLVYFRIKKWF